MITLILVRHGQSQWNLENRFTGWVDVPLTDKGEQEARQTGKQLKAQGIVVDKCFVSPLSRAQRTASLIREELGQSFTFTESAEIIERFYGSLTGLNKAETAETYGEEQVHLWRRSYDIAPPALTEDDAYHPSNHEPFRGFSFHVPLTESLKDVVERVEPFWNNILKPQMQPGKTILLVAHGNSIRALIKLIRGISDDDIKDLEIATGVPTILTFDDTGVLQDSPSKAA
jgi:2,3-bisphosphoglycerate-dependent phosphoglycerate mutase